MCSFSRDTALVLVEAQLSLEVLLALGFVNVGVGLSFQLSCMMLFISFRVDLARPLMLGTLEAMLGILNCAESNFSTGLVTLLDFLLDELSDPVTCGLMVCSFSSKIWRRIYFSGSGYGIVTQTGL